MMPKVIIEAWCHCFSKTGSDRLIQGFPTVHRHAGRPNTNETACRQTGFAAAVLATYRLVGHMQEGQDRRQTP